MVNPYFNGQYYLTNNPDVAAAYGLSTAAAEQHYLNYGAGEALSGAAPSRKPAPWFDIKYYLDHNPDLVDAGLNANDLFTHFTTYGMLEGRSPNADVGTITDADLLAYANANADLRAAFDIDDGATSLTDAQQDALTQHFYQFGYTEGRPAPLFGSSEPDDNGQTFRLTADFDDLTGTAGDDHFKAPITQTPFMGSVTNSLASGDELDGGSGYDSLFAQLMAETSGTGASTLAVEPYTKNIEKIEIEARDFGITQAFDINFGAGLSLGELGDLIDYMFGDIIEDITSDIELPGVPETDSAQVLIDYILDNLSFALGGSYSTGRGQAVLDAKHMYGIERIGSKDSDGHLKIQNLNTLMNDGETKRNTDAITITMDHTDNVNSVGEASDLIVYFDENYLISGQASEGMAFYWLLDQNSDEIGGPLLKNINVDGIRFSIDGGPTIVLNSPAAIAADTHQQFLDALNVRLAEMLADGTVPEGTTLTLDYDRSETTYLDNGAVSSPVPALVLKSGDGAPVTAVGFNVVADQPGKFNLWADIADSYESEITPITTNIELHKVGRGGEGGDLIVGGKDVVNGKGIEVFNVTVMGDESKPSHVSSLNSTAGALATVNVTTDANVTGVNGFADLTIDNLGGSYQNVGGRLVPETDVQRFDSTTFNGDLTLSTTLNEHGNGAHVYQLGDGDDTLNIDFGWELLPGGVMYVFGGVAGDTLSVTTGGGDDLIRIGGEFGADLDSLSIHAGEGDNTIFFDTFNANTFTDGIGARIDSGSGSDAIYLNDGKSDWTGINIPAGIPESTKMFKAKLQLNVADVQSEWVDISWDKNKFTTSREDIVQAIQAAIDSNSALAGMVEIIPLTDGTLTARSLVTGGAVMDIDIRAPHAVASEIVGNTGLKVVANGSGSGWDQLNVATSLNSSNSVGVSQLQQAWNVWYPESVGFNGTAAADLNSGVADFGPISNAGEVLDSMQTTSGIISTFLSNRTLDGPDSNAEGGDVINSGAGDDLIVLNDVIYWWSSGTTVEMTEANFGTNTIVNFDVGGSSSGNLDDNDILDFTSYLDSVANERGASVITENARVKEAVRYNVDDMNWILGDNIGPNGFDHNSINTGNFAEIFALANPGSEPANFDALSTGHMSAFFSASYGAGDFIGGTSNTTSALGNNFLVLVAKNGDVTKDVAGNLTWNNAGSGSAADDGVFKVFEGTLNGFDNNGDAQVSFELHGTIDLAEIDVIADINPLTGADVFGII